MKDWLVAFGCIAVMYAMDYQHGDFPRLGFLVAVVGASFVFRGFLNAQCPGGTRGSADCLNARGWFLLIGSTALLVVVVLFVLPFHAEQILMPEPFPELYSNTYKQPMKPVAQVIWMACLMTCSYATLAADTWASKFPREKTRFWSRVLVYTAGFLALLPEVAAFAFWALTWFWRFVSVTSVDDCRGCQA
ncbi:MAG: hypothetical protein AAF351_11930 [Pseudomonadota bacterium]